MCDHPLWLGPVVPRSASGGAWPPHPHLTTASPALTRLPRCRLHRWLPSLYPWPRPLLRGLRSLHSRLCPCPFMRPSVLWRGVVRRMFAALRLVPLCGPYTGCLWLLLGRSPPVGRLPARSPSPDPAFVPGAGSGGFSVYGRGNACHSVRPMRGGSRVVLDGTVVLCVFPCVRSLVVGSSLIPYSRL